MKISSPALCPSAQPGMANCRAFGVIQGTPTNPRVAWLERPIPVTDDLLTLTGSVPPTQVLRLAAPCQEDACCHFDGTDCQLATKLVQILPSVVESLPACQIRADCRWFRQEGNAACERCPQIVTYYVNPTAELSWAATP